MVSMSELMELARKLGLLVEMNKYKDKMTNLQVDSFKFFREVHDGSGCWKPIITHLTYREDVSRQDYLDKLGKAYNDLKQFEGWN